MTRLFIGLVSLCVVAPITSASARCCLVSGATPHLTQEACCPTGDCATQFAACDEAPVRLHAVRAFQPPPLLRPTLFSTVLWSHTPLATPRFSTTIATRASVPPASPLSTLSLPLRL